MTKQTENYEIFKKHSQNREINERVVLRLMNSIKTRNLLEYRPLLVNKKMEVIDGQHRLEAAKRLCIPIYYTVEEEIDIHDMITLNQTASLWNLEDYLNYYCQSGSEEYQKLKKFMDTYNLSIDLTISILGRPGGGKGCGRFSQRFKAGVYQFPSSGEEEHSLKILNQSKILLEYTLPKIEGRVKFLEGPKFRRALYIFLSIRVVDFDIFMGKLAMRLDLLRPCVSIKEFLRVLKMIYNYRNREPLSLDEDEIKDL